MRVEADDDECTYIFARELIEIVEPRLRVPAHRYVSIGIPALFDELQVDSEPSLAWRLAQYLLWASGGAIVGTALAVFLART
jgi:hypothetical protein